jgi:FKBP-type peptidyl-prolyl cis-trans isomerase SlyD
MDSTTPSVADGMVVTFDFTLTLDGGEVADTTQGEMPLRFIVGEGQLLPGLEDAMIGMTTGEERDITLNPEDAYGEWDEDALEEVAMSDLPGGMELEEGMPLEVTDTEGDTYEASVYEVRNDTVVLDYNHPLAGETLQFHVKVIDIRPATPEELDHGHVHDADGHAH